MKANFLRTLTCWLFALRSRTRARAAVAAIVVTAAMTGAAFAQGTSGMLPDPITSGELMRYADRLGLSDQQRAALERLHDDYRDEFRRLRDSDIDSFLKEMRELYGSGMNMPDRDRIESLMRRWRRASERIRAVDDSLFNNMRGILTEQQVAELPRVRMARERARYLANQQMAMMGGRQLVDLSDLVLTVDLHPSERQAIDPLLHQYEHHLTRSLKDLYETSSTLYVDMYDAMEEQGFTDLDMETLAQEDPAIMQEMMQTMQQIMQRIFEGVISQSRAIHELNRRTISNIQTRLSERSARAYRNQFYSLAYPESAFAQSIPAQRHFEAALRLDGLDEQTIQQLEAAQTDTVRQLDAILAQVIEAIDERHAGGGVFSFDQDAWRRFGERQGELQKQARALDEQARKTVQQLLGERAKATTFDESLAQVEEEHAERLRAPTRTRRSASVVVADADDADDDAPQALSRRRHSGHFPPAIDVRDRTMYAQVLELDEGSRAVLEELHLSYKERYDQHAERWRAVLAEAEQAQSGYNPETGEHSAPTVEAVDMLFRKRAEAIDAALEVDETFFDDIDRALLSEDDMDRLDRVRWNRQRAVYDTMAAASGMQMMFGSHRAADVDLTRLVRLQRLREEDVSRLEPILHEYERTAAPVARDRYQYSSEMSRIMQRQSVLMQQRDDDDEGGAFAFGFELQRVMKETAVKAQQSLRDMAEINTNTLDQMTALLSTDSARRLREAFNRQAFPRIYRDPSSVDKHIDQAMNLPDLTSQQRERLTELALAYRPAYSELSEQMVALNLHATSINPWAAEQEDWQQMTDRANETSRLMFERNELNARAIRQLSTILTAEQINQIGGLPQPVEDVANPWEFN